MSDRVYPCGYIAGAEVPWEAVEGVELTHTVHGGAPRLRTVVRICRTDECLHFRFECEDDHTVATYTDRDDPIYREDVVEIFVDEEGKGTHYKEYEFSPRNVIFDALVVKEPGQSPQVNTTWDHEGLRSTVSVTEDGIVVYEIGMPVAAFGKPPVSGTEWRINLYRIDDDRQGERHYWAWSPTGLVNFHRPDKFGTLRFL